MFVLKYDQEMLVLDAGLKFPEEDMLGIDVVIPDISFLIENRSLIKGIVLTHGHEDHIGAMPYINSELRVPVYGSRLTLGLLRAKMEEFELLEELESHEIAPDQRLKISSHFELEFFRTNHSIPDSLGVVIYNPVGTVVYTSDYKFDQTPVDGETTDFYKLSRLGKEGVMVALSDSTNSDRPGFTPSEKEVGETIDDIFRLSRNRIIFATFASNIHRIQQVINAAHLYQRKICVVGRSIENSVRIACELGYLNIPPGMIIDQGQIGQCSPQKLAVITTGSQGEPMSALTRISVSDHRFVEIMEGDTVIISASPIPGNEKLVARTVNNLFRRGADVIYKPLFDVHVSGHGSEEEIKMMLNLLRPEYLIPVHGEYRHLVYQARIAEKVGIPRNNIFLVDPGTVMEFSRGRSRINGMVSAGKILVDGLGVGDVGRVVLRDRRLLSEEGIVVVVLVIDPTRKDIVAGPEIITRGFIYVRESEQLLEEARSHLLQCLQQVEAEQLLDWNAIKSRVREAAGTYFYNQTGRRPMILPVIMETS